MKGRSHPGEEYLPWDEVRPSVELAGFVALNGEKRYNYRNPAHHLILVDSGHVECNPPGGSFVALPGDLICFRPAERNRYTSRGQTTFYQAVIEFAPPPRHRLTPVWDDVGPLPVKISLGDAMITVRRHFETICLELPHAGSVHQLRVRIAVFEILAIIAGLAARRDGADAVSDDPWQHARIMLESQLATGLRVDRLAQQMGMSVNHFILRFRHRFGTTPKAYHTRARLREGARLLRDPERSVKSIAYLLGFSGTKAFTRRFHHHYGVNPSDLRGTASGVTDVVSPPRELLFAVNQHILPPHVGSDYLNQYLVRPSK